MGKFLLPVSCFWRPYQVVFGLDIMFVAVFLKLSLYNYWFVDTGGIYV